MSLETLAADAIAQGSGPAVTVLLFALWLRGQFRTLTGQVQELVEADKHHKDELTSLWRKQGGVERRLDVLGNETQHLERRVGRVEKRFDMTPVDPISIERGKNR